MVVELCYSKPIEEEQLRIRPKGPAQRADTEDPVLAICKPSRFLAKPMKAAIVLNDDPGNRDF